MLTGIHLSSYGIDIEDDLLHLIEQVHEIEGIQRIRLGSLEPKIVTEEFAKRLSELEKICPHFTCGSISQTCAGASRPRSREGQGFPLLRAQI